MQSAETSQNVTPNPSAPNFDPLARAYRWMEYFSFGPMLERCRFHFLPVCKAYRQALIFGDGDGRFTARLLTKNRHIEVDAVDASPAMLTQLRKRVAEGGIGFEARLRTFHADIRCFSPTKNDYDLVVSHFFLDCLTEEQVDALITRTLPYLSPKALWLVSEFAIPDKGCRRFASRLLIRWLYFWFGKMTHLEVQKIPDYSLALARNGFQRREQICFLGGLLVAETWERKDL